MSNEDVFDGATGENPFEDTVAPQLTLKPKLDGANFVLSAVSSDDDCDDDVYDDDDTDDTYKSELVSCEVKFTIRATEKGKIIQVIGELRDPFGDLHVEESDTEEEVLQFLRQDIDDLRADVESELNNARRALREAQEELRSKKAALKDVIEFAEKLENPDITRSEELTEDPDEEEEEE